MNQRQAALLGLLAYTALVAAATFLITDELHQREQVAQIYAPEVRTSPADVALEVKPDAKPSLPAPTPARGGTVVSTTEVTVSGQKPRVRKPPKREHDGGDVSMTCPTADDFECPPLDLRLDLIEVDGQQYMAVRGPDGTEVTGQYLPRAAVAVVRKNKAGIDLYADDTKVIRYQRRVLDRFWAGPAAMIEPDGSLVPGITIEGEWE